MAVSVPPPPVDFDAARIDKGPLTPLQLKREAIVREHMDTENRHEVEPAIATSPTARATSSTACTRSSTATRRSTTTSPDLWRTFPDLRAELINVRHAEDAVIIEVELAATASTSCPSRRRTPALCSPVKMFVAVPRVTPRPAERGIELDLGAGRTRVFTNRWRADQTTAFRSTGIPNIDTYTALPRPVRLIMRSSRRAGRLYASRPWQALLRRAIRLMPEGPSEKQLAKGSSYVFGAVQNAAGERAEARLRGPEVNRFTP